MSHVTYKIVEHDGGWAYKVDGVFSEPIPHARRRSSRQQQPGRSTPRSRKSEVIEPAQVHTESGTGSGIRQPIAGRRDGMMKG